MLVNINQAIPHNVHSTFDYHAPTLTVTTVLRMERPDWLKCREMVHGRAASESACNSASDYLRYVDGHWHQTQTKQ